LVNSISCGALQLITIDRLVFRSEHGLFSKNPLESNDYIGLRFDPNDLWLREANKVDEDLINGEDDEQDWGGIKLWIKRDEY
jgi:hypothetical protein